MNILRGMFQRAHSKFCPARRNPEETRRAILDAAFEEIHAQGFRNASLDNILKKTGVTKGALYYHFPNKAELGYAVLDEMIMPHYYAEWQPVVDPTRDPIDALVEVLTHIHEKRTEHFVAMGCPVTNLVQEMSGLDEGFHKRLRRMMDDWVGAVEKALLRGQVKGVVRKDVDATDAARMIVSTFQGCASFAKASQDAGVFRDCLQSLVRYCGTLRTASS